MSIILELIWIQMSTLSLDFITLFPHNFRTTGSFKAKRTQCSRRYAEMALSSQITRSLGPILWKYWSISRKQNCYSYIILNSLLAIVLADRKLQSMSNVLLKAASRFCMSPTALESDTDRLHLYQVVLHSNSNMKGYREHWSGQEVEAVVGVWPTMKKALVSIPVTESGGRGGDGGRKPNPALLTAQSLFLSSAHELLTAI